MSSDGDVAPGLRGELILALALGGPLAAGELARRVGASGEPLSGALALLEREGAAERRLDADGVARLRLTRAGAERATAFLAAERARIGAALEAVLPAFDASNGALKALLHRWQLRPEGSTSVVNDHRDPRYDDGVLQELGRLVAGADPWLEELGRLRPRYARYRERIVAALARAGAGETEQVAGLAVDSVHSVWWQLHADLLAVLGRVRGEADA